MYVHKIRLCLMTLIFVFSLSLLPGVLVIVAALATVAVSAAAVLRLEIEVVQSDSCGTDHGQEDQAVSQNGGIHLHQTGGEVHEEDPGIAQLIEFLELGG